MSGDSCDGGGNAPRDERDQDRRTLITILGARPDAEAAADRLLARFGTLPAILSNRAAAIARCVDYEVARLLNAVRLAGLSLIRLDVARPVAIRDTRQCVRYLRARLAHSREERFHVLHLDGSQRLIADENAGTGTVDQVVIHPRELVGRALELGSTAIIIAHNHPSGDAKPSEEDVQTSWRVAAAARTMGLVLQDHIIVTKGGWTSLRAEGLL